MNLFNDIPPIPEIDEDEKAFRAKFPDLCNSIELRKKSNLRYSEFNTKNCWNCKFYNRQKNYLKQRTGYCKIFGQLHGLDSYPDKICDRFIKRVG
ncbi:MAG: hypothetical protein KDK36_20030 [Leptospiraceae bacterium]|nr:hypothetical protein [Leptospiraceae bacterium]